MVEAIPSLVLYSLLKQPTTTWAQTAWLLCTCMSWRRASRIGTRTPGSSMGDALGLEVTSMNAIIYLIVLF